MRCLVDHEVREDGHEKRERGDSGRLYVAPQEPQVQDDRQGISRRFSNFY